MVVKVLEATRNSVVSGASRFSVSARWAPSTLDEVDARSVVIGAERQRHHRRAEIRAADADIDDVGERFAGRAGDVARAHPVGEGAEGVQHRLDVGHHVVAADGHRPGRGA
jgi:hypothetical protein